MHNFYYEKIGNKTTCIQDEIPFEIPESWNWLRLDDFGLFKKGPFGSSLTKSMFVPENTPGRIKVYEQKNAIQKDQTIGNYFISKSKFYTMQGFLVEPGDIIVSCAGTIGEIFVLPCDSEIGIINQALMRIKLYLNSIKEYFILYFDSVLKKEADDKGKGTAIKNIPPFDILKKMLVPLPPEKEIKRILNKADQIIKITSNISDWISDIKKTNLMIKSKVLDSFFGENSSYKSYYNKYLLRDLFSFQNGYAFSSSLYSDEGVSIIRISNLDDGIVTTNDVIKTKEKNIDEKFIVKKGDLLIALSGATTGKMGVFNSDGLYYLNQRVGCIRITDSSKITANYRNYLFMHLREKILQNAHGDAQPNISGQKILSLSCYLPNIEMQEKIAKKIEEIFYFLDCVNNI